MDRRTGDTCILIPTYNNAGTLLDVVGRAVAQGLPTVVVNDGSTDETAALLAQSPLPVQVLTHPRNRGKGIALKTGLEWARRAGYAYAITLDADGQHFPEDIPTFPLLPDDMKDIIVPKLVLQPLLEKAIRSQPSAISRQKSEKAES